MMVVRAKEGPYKAIDLLVSSNEHINERVTRVYEKEYESIKACSDYMIIQLLDKSTKRRASPHLCLLKRPTATPRQPEYLHSSNTSSSHSNTKYNIITYISIWNLLTAYMIVVPLLLIILP
ncbi:transmembrane protein, putative [Medicago truncatula]|uniref:Transmembrane protein, putative n=1 Tax=Medicago truncatula TaxID=3880 RepID=A0A072TWV6_MEDTR|nr:transmembrane protein, putative [Medicago truncatula]